MRTQCKQRFMGTGLTPAIEPEDAEDFHLSRNRRYIPLDGVVFPHDSYLKDEDKLASLSGPVTTYWIGVKG